MSEQNRKSEQSRKIVVPEGMMDAGRAVYSGYVTAEVGARRILEEALLWLTENPIVPTDDECDELINLIGANGKSLVRYPSRIDRDQAKTMIVEAQRRMFDAPEPEIPAEIKDLLMGSAYISMTGVVNLNPEWDSRIIEAFRRGQKSAAGGGGGTGENPLPPPPPST